MISSGRESIDSIDSKHFSEADIVAHYFNVYSLPHLMKSPLRSDKFPSFALYSPNGVEVNYRDFGTQESGTIWTLLSRLWSCSYEEVLRKVYNDLGSISYRDVILHEGRQSKVSIGTSSVTELRCKVRAWEKHDLEYWESYGISLEWLKYADVYPISHKIVIKDGQSFIFGADRYAYAYVEFKDGKTTLKIYQPFNCNGYKWSNNHDKSVISLWTKVPLRGKQICICSSLKDALCLWANTGIPSIAIQGEGYGISNTAVAELRKRYGKIYICLDNDEVGLQDAKLLSEKTGFENIILPSFTGGKDISDLYKVLNDKEKFRNHLLQLFI